MSPISWVFNLDAEDELARPGSMTPPQRLRARVALLTPQLGAFVGPGDRVIDEFALVRDSHKGTRGVAWCATPRARKALATAGARLGPAVPDPVLRRVNSRAFSAAILQGLPGAVFARSTREVRAMVEALGGAPALCKRALSHNARGRRRVRAPLAEADLYWIEKSLQESEGLQCEPEVERVDDWGLHGWLSPAGQLTRGALTRQRIDPLGQWQASAQESAPELEAALSATLSSVAEALVREGYHGPFGIDAFRYRGPRGVALQPLSEVNARFSMGFAAGFGDRLKSLLEE